MNGVQQCLVFITCTERTNNVNGLELRVCQQKEDHVRQACHALATSSVRPERIQQVSDWLWEAEKHAYRYLLC